MAEFLEKYCSDALPQYINQVLPLQYQNLPRRSRDDADHNAFVWRAWQRCLPPVKSTTQALLGTITIRLAEINSLDAHPPDGFDGYFSLNTFEDAITAGAVVVRENEGFDDVLAELRALSTRLGFNVSAAGALLLLSLLLLLLLLLFKRRPLHGGAGLDGTPRLAGAMDKRGEEIKLQFTCCARCAPPSCPQVRVDLAKGEVKKEGRRQKHKAVLKLMLSMAGGRAHVGTTWVEKVGDVEGECAGSGLYPRQHSV